MSAHNNDSINIVGVVALSLLLIVVYLAIPTICLGGFGNEGW